MGRSVTCDRPSKLAKCSCCHRTIPSKEPPLSSCPDEQRLRSVGSSTPVFSEQRVFRVNRSQGSTDYVYVHQACILHNSDGVDVAQQKGESQIKAILGLIAKGRGKHCHTCTNNGANIPTGALLHCAAVEGCGRRFHLPCVPHVTVTTDEDGYTTTKAYCEEHRMQSLAAETVQQPTASTPEMKSPSPAKPQQSSSSTGSFTGNEIEGSMSSAAADVADAADVTAIPSSAATDLSSSAGFCQHVLQDFVALLTDRPTGHLDLSYMQGLAENAIKQLQAIVTRGVTAVIVGPNNIGKTTILNLVLFLTAMTNQQYIQEAAKVEATQLRALKDRSADELCIGFSNALQSGTRGVRSVLRLSQPAVYTSSSSSSSEPATLLTALQQVLATNKQYTSDRLHLLTQSLHVVTAGQAADGQDEEKVVDKVEQATPEFVCLALNAEGHTYLSHETMQKALRERWEKPLREASERALTPDDILPWLLRSADVGLATTAHICRLLYAPFWHGTVHFMTEELAQEMSFSYVAQMLDRFSKQVAVSDDDKELKLAKAQYDALVSRPLSTFDWSKCPDITASGVERMLALDESMTDASLKATPEYRRANKPGQSKLAFPSDRSLMPFSPEVQPLLGRRLLFKGAGRDFTADREFVRRQLHFWTNCHAARHAILFCSVYAPCTVLTGLELWDTPGMDDRSPIRQWLLREALQQADVVMCILQRGATYNSTAIEELVQSKVLERKVLSSNEVGHVAFLHYIERGQKHPYKKFAEELRMLKSADGDDDAEEEERSAKVGEPDGISLSLEEEDSGDLSGASSMSTTSISTVVHNLDLDSREEVLNCLQRAEQKAAIDGGQARTREELRVLMERRVTFRCIFPVMFTSLLLKQASDVDPSTVPSASSDTVQEEDRQRVLNFTGGYELCGLLRSCVPTLCQQLITKFIGESGCTEEKADQVGDPDQDLVQRSATSGDELETKASHEGQEMEEEKEEKEDDGEESNESNEDDSELDRSQTLLRMQPHSPHPTLDQLDEASRLLQSEFPHFCPGSLLLKLCSNVASFTLEHLELSEASREVYERIRLSSAVYSKYMHTNTWNSNTKQLLETMERQTRTQQEQREERLVDAVVSWQQEHLVSEMRAAQRSVLRQWDELSSQVTAVQLDPKKNGAAKPVELRRLLMGHFSDLSCLHVHELHSRLRDTWEELFDQVKIDTFEEALRRMLPSVSNTDEFRSAMNRVGDFAFREPLLREWDDYMTCNDERTLTQKAAQGISQHRLFTLMQQLGKEHLQQWLEERWPSWKKRFRRDKQRVLQEVRAGLVTVLDDTVEEFGVVVQQRLRLTLRHFMTKSFWWRRKQHHVLPRPCLLDSALKHFLREAHSYDRDRSDEQLRSSVRGLLRALRGWESRARLVVQAVGAFDPALLGREMVSSTQRNERYSMWVAKHEMSEPVVQLIRLAQNRSQPHNPHSKLISGQVIRETAGRMFVQWQEQQQHCPSTPSLPERIRRLNLQLRRSKQKLAVHEEFSFGAGCSASATTYTVDHLLRSVAISLMTGGDPDCVDESTERHVQELVENLKAMVAANLDRRTETSSLGSAVRKHYGCSSQELNERLLQGHAYYCPIILQLLSALLRVHISVWTLDSAAKEGKVQVLYHQLQPNSKAKAVALRYVHLAFLPQWIAEGNPPVARLPYCVLPLFTAEGAAVSYSDVDQVTHYTLDNVRSRPLESTRAFRQSQVDRKKRRPMRERSPDAASPSSPRSPHYPVSAHSTRNYDHQQQITGARNYAALRSASASQGHTTIHQSHTQQPDNDDSATASLPPPSSAPQSQHKRLKLEAKLHS